MAKYKTDRRNIAIFGGTFDPIHLGHLLIAQQALSFFSLDEVIFMPAGIPPHKNKKGLTPSDKRLKMVKKAIRDNPSFSCSDYEFKKEGCSYTADTLRYFKQLQIADKIYLIIGADSLLQIFSWQEPRYLLKNGYFIVARRPGFELNGVLAKDKYSPYRKRIFIMDMIETGFSSTLIRKLVREGRSIKYQTRDEVVDYINRHALYRGD
ncbi:MAG TPA: nicotinate-nucleotide adenylyltransferase [Halanaerobiales bacterium]|nr:nicotinate-nucleotide adenylyltransferase [Halanaerobiales bacterium]